MASSHKVFGPWIWSVEGRGEEVQVGEVDERWDVLLGLMLLQDTIKVGE
jgi:hypothetical protein